MKTAHTSSKHIGIIWRTLAAAAAIVIVLLMAGNDSAASNTPTTTTAPAPTTATSAPAGLFKPGLPEVPGHDPTDLLWKMLAATVVILVLGVLLFVVVKRLLPKIARTTGKRISVLETVYLQPKKALHLIQVGSRKLLIASSPEGLVRLDDVTDAIGPDYAETARRIENESKEAAKANENKQSTAE